MKWKLFSFIFASMLALSACGTTGDDTGNKDDTGDNDDNVENTKYNDTAHDRNNGQTIRNEENADKDRGNLNRDNDRNNKRDNNARYDVSKDAANRITDEVEGIDHAYVLTTKNNAYVAAALDEDHDGKRNNKRNNDQDGTNVNDRNNVNDHDADRDNDRADRNRDHDMNDRDHNKDGAHNNRADKGHEVTDDTKREIKDIIQDEDNDIDHVYVSTNPDFMNLANNYADDMNDGKPVRGMFDQIGNMIERVFPQSRNNR